MTTLSLLINAKAISITAGPKRLISEGNRVREASLSETLWPLVVVVKSLGCLSKPYLGCDNTAINLHTPMCTGGLRYQIFRAGNAQYIHCMPSYQMIARTTDTETQGKRGRMEGEGERCGKGEGGGQCRENTIRGNS